MRTEGEVYYGCRVWLLFDEKKRMRVSGRVGSVKYGNLLSGKALSQTF